MEIKPIPPHEPSNKHPESKKKVHPSIPAVMEQLAQLFRDVLQSGNEPGKKS